MNNYIIPNRLVSTILLMVMTLAHFAWGQEMKKGAFILISLEGTVTFLGWPREKGGCGGSWTIHSGKLSIGNG